MIIFLLHHEINTDEFSYEFVVINVYELTLHSLGR